MKTSASVTHFFNTCISNSRRTDMSRPCKVPDQARPVLRSAVLVAAMGAAFISPAAWAFNSGSTGADGALSPTVNTEIQVPPSGILNYISVNIPAGVTVTFKKNVLNTPVYLLLSGDASVAGTIDISGTPGAQTGTSGDGKQADDGLPGQGGPGGFGGGRGGRDDPAQSTAIIRGGGGLGPGGGSGGTEGADGCDTTTAWYYKYIGGPAGYATDGSKYSSAGYCGTAYATLSKRQGKAYGSSILQPLIGGSGGGGGRGGTAYAGSGGGGGGGAILIAASGTINLTGLIKADGGGAGYPRGDNVGGAGSGGSGGAIRLVATTVTGAGRAVAVGGCLHDPTRDPTSKYVYYNATSAEYYVSAQVFDCSFYGASEGRIRIEAENITFSGRALPAYSTDVPGPVFLSSLPGLRIAAVAGQAVPANPTGSADLTFPANLTNPVTVDLATTNVPTGNTVLVKVIPAYGDTQEVQSPAITGTAASGSASVQVTLPQGPSVLQATTTYTVVVAMGEALSRFAHNERVEKVQLMASLGGQSQAKLITISGKEYLVPVSVLQMVGFIG